MILGTMMLGNKKITGQTERGSETQITSNKIEDHAMVQPGPPP